MAKLCSQQDCTSCMACYNACPFDAISIVKTSLSALYPVIDVNKCKDCGLCEKSCPILEPPLLKYPSEAIALYCKDKEDRRTCSSGGFVTTAARAVISAGGVVYGATAIDGYPEFRKVSTSEELDIFKGSKYVYCDPAKIYRDVKAELASGTECLFVGLPCDVAGLRQYLRRDYDNLFTIDLICHGAPPFEYLRSHLESKLGRVPQLGNLKFRGGEHDFHMSAFDKNGHLIYCCNQYEDEYFAAFMRGIIYRPCCYECRLARPERVSDITAGDFWGLDSEALGGYKGKVSLALINTYKGLAFFESMSDLVNWERRDITEAIEGNRQLNCPTELTSAAKKFRDVYAARQSVKEAFKAAGIKALTRKNKLRRIALFLPKKILRTLKVTY